MKGNFTLLLPDTHCHTRPVQATPSSWSQIDCPAPQHSTAVEICTVFQDIRLGFCCLTHFLTPNIHTHSHGRVPVLPVAFTGVLSLFPAFSITTPVPHPPRAPEQFHNPMWIKTSAGRPRTNPSAHKTPKSQRQGFVIPPHRSMSSQSPSKSPSTQDQHLLQPWAGDLLWRPRVKPSRAEMKPSLSREEQVFGEP